VGLKVGQLARLYDTYSRPQLMYRAEIWSITSVARLKELERTQNAAGRHIFGRGGGASVIEEAVRGNLGWLTMESRVALAKLRFYGRLCQLPDTRLVRIIFQHSQSEMGVYLQMHNELPSVNSSWCASIYHALCTLNPLTFWPDCSRASAPEWNKLCLERT
jgi:hypothetical protein